MKLRFGIDASAPERIRGHLDTLCEAPAIGRRLSYVYLDTPDGALASHGVALRFRRKATMGTPASRRPWKRQIIWLKGQDEVSLKRLGIPRLKQRLDATFTVRIERWTWVLEDGSAVSIDQSEIATGRAEERFAELRIVCKKKHADRATHFAVELGATALTSMRARERGLALSQGQARPD